jgi:sodium-dependent phosphate cotransporter
VRHAIEPLPRLVVEGIADSGIGNNLVVPGILVLLSLALLFLSLWQLTKMVRQLMIGRMKERLEKVFFGHPLKALGWGVGITALVQSSSATTSLTVPLVATGKVALRKAFPFIIGANIGTTATAILAALLATGDQFKAGLAVAFCHVLFNVFGAAILFPIPQIRRIPVAMARKLGAWTMNNRLVGISYIAITFFLIPFLLILASNQVDHEAVRKQKAEKQSESGLHLEQKGKVKN